MMEEPKDKVERYTYADYLEWPEDERWEIIEGVAYDMTPAPTMAHQAISAALHALLWQYFEEKPCKALAAPVDVRLPDGDEEDGETDTVVQPDLLVVCDPSKIDKKGVRGAPDLVLEILSESTAAKDQNEKLRLYEKHGVRCYIVVDPWGHTLTVRYWEAMGKFGRPELFTKTDRMPIRIFEGLELELPRVFAGI